MELKEKIATYIPQGRYTYSCSLRMNAASDGARTIRVLFGVQTIELSMIRSMQSISEAYNFEGCIFG